MKIAICDDEPNMLYELEKRIYAFFEEKHIEADIALFTSGKALMESGSRPDVLFLDIQMEAPNGYETAVLLRQSGYDGILIFITVLQDYVFDSFAVQAFDYLLKPIQESSFLHTMQRLVKSVQSNRQSHLLIQKGNKWSIIRFCDIVYCEVINRKVYLYLKDGAVIDYYEQIDTLEKKLDRRFFRCHRSYLVNLQYLKSYKPCIASLITGQTIPVSRLRNDAFAAAVLRHMKEGGR